VKDAVIYMDAMDDVYNIVNRHTHNRSPGWEGGYLGSGTSNKAVGQNVH
jgi:hypothetical protein